MCWFKCWLKSQFCNLLLMPFAFSIEILLVLLSLVKSSSSSSIYLKFLLFYGYLFGLNSHFSMSGRHCPPPHFLVRLLQISQIFYPYTHSLLYTCLFFSMTPICVYPRSLFIWTFFYCLFLCKFFFCSFWKSNFALQIFSRSWFSRSAS